MLHLYETKKAKRVAIAAVLLTLTTAGIAVARQEPQFPGLPPANGNSTSGTANTTISNGQGLQPILLRVAQYQRAASIKGNSGHTAVRVSYSAANQAFGDMLRAIGGATPVAGITASTSDRTVNISSEQAASDVRLLKSAARQAKSADEENRLRKAASLYATGAKEFLTAQLREALLETDVAAPVVVKGSAKEADAAIRAQTQAPPDPAPPAPAPNTNPAPKPNPAPAPNPDPNPAPVPDPAPNPQPDPNPQPAPQPADPNNPPPAPAPNPPVPQNLPGV